MVAFNDRAAVLGLRIAQAIMAIIVLGTTAYVASWWDGYWNAYSPDCVNFLIFTAVWTLLALIYLVLVPWQFSDSRAHHPFAILGVEAVTMIFWFAGFIALAVFIGERHCSGNVCRSIQAATVFGAFEWLAFAITTTMAAMHISRHRRSTSSNAKADPNLNVQPAV